MSFFVLFAIRLATRKVEINNGTNVTIHSDESELVLLKVLKALNENEIEIEDLSAVPTNLEEIFLKMVEENASNL